MHPLVYIALPTSRDFCAFSAIVLVPVGLAAAVWSVRDPGRPLSHFLQAITLMLCNGPSVSQHLVQRGSVSSPDLSGIALAFPSSPSRPWYSGLSSQRFFWRGKVRPEDWLSTECDRVWDRRLLLLHRFSQPEVHRELCVMVPSWWLSPLLGLGRGFQDDSPWVIPSPHQGVLDLSLFCSILCGLSSPEHLSGS